jgi:hypothetical protein
LSPAKRKVVPISGIGVVLLLTGRIRERNRDLIEEGDYKFTWLVDHPPIK